MTVPASNQFWIKTPIERPLPFSQSLTLTGTGVPTYLTFEYRGTWYYFMDDVEIAEMVAPVANFTVTTDATGNIDYDSIVSFINTSVAEGATYSWNFGDATGLGTKNTSTLKDPVPVKYTKPGKYTITLTVTNGAGTNSKSIEVEVKALDAPIANFTTVITGLRVKFTNTSTPDISSPASIATTYSWDFGDGATSVQKSPTDKTYATKGKYNICLTAKNRAGENTKCSEVTLTSSISNVDFGQIKIFPNPVRDGKIYIQNDMNLSLSYRVTDMLGKVISAERLISNKDSQIDLSNAPNGIYFIEVESKGEKVIKKIIVDKQ
jgi:PKD repeat protein